MNNILKNVSLAACLAPMFFSGCTKQKAEPYNVLFLSVDDMNNYAFYGEYPQSKMPYLDKFKESAVTFSHAYCSSPVCTPSRAANYSGLHAHSTGAYFNGSDPWNKSEQLMNCETLPELFKRAGYYSWGRGKLYHAKLSEGRDAKNFDNKYWGGGFGPFPDEEHQIKGNFWGIQAFPDSVFPDVINSDEAIKFLQQDHFKPFFLTLGLWRPHTPFTCPQRFYDMYNVNDINLPKGYNSDDINDIPDIAKELLDPFGRFNPEDTIEWKRLIHAYLACNTFADYTIGKVIEALDNSKYAKNTIVVLWSDNGYHCGEKNHWEKNTLWEQAARTPMAIRIPGSKQNGKVCNIPVSLVDLYPTLVDYCQLPEPKHALDGVSLKKALENVSVNWDRTAVTTFGEGFASIRDARYRYIVYSDGSKELYDHSNDPNELINLAYQKEYKTVIEKLSAHVPKKFAKALKGRRS